MSETEILDMREQTESANQWFRMRRPEKQFRRMGMGHDAHHPLDDSSPGEENNVNMLLAGLDSLDRAEGN